MSYFINHENELIAYFSVSSTEFYEFWNSLTYPEKLYYRRAPLN